MGKGLLAQWRRGIFARGLAGAAMLVVPVAVAATIGFGTSLSGVTEGLGALASGPAGTQQAAADRPGTETIDGAISAVATSTSGGDDAANGGPVAGSPGGDDGGTETDGGGAETGPVPPAPATGTGGGTTGGTTGGAETPAQPLPQVDVPSTGGGLDGLLDGLGNTVQSLLGGGA